MVENHWCCPGFYHLLYTFMLPFVRSCELCWFCVCFASEFWTSLGSKWRHGIERLYVIRACVLSSSRPCVKTFFYSHLTCPAGRLQSVTTLEHLGVHSFTYFLYCKRRLDPEHIPLPTVMLSSATSRLGCEGKASRGHVFLYGQFSSSEIPLLKSSYCVTLGSSHDFQCGQTGPALATWQL